MRFLTADFIYAPAGLKDNLVLVTGEDGAVIELCMRSEIPAEKMEVFEGVLSPGFINAHCHLELSHLFNKIPAKTGLPGFAQQVVKLRNETPENQRIAKSVEADSLMFEKGIQACGDIVNGTDSFAAKRQAKLRYHSFIEVLGFHPSRAEASINGGIALKENCPGTASLSPHAPYSVSETLMKGIQDIEVETGKPLSLHLSESLAEDEFFLSGDGAMMELYKGLGLDLSWWQAPGTSSARNFMPYLDASLKILLVHCTELSTEDRRFILDGWKGAHFCLCPNANLYIEEKVPDVPGMLEDGCKMLIGTDSLASNWQLDVLAELKIIHQHFPDIPTETLLKMATQNGADFFRWDDFGRFEKGCAPGVVQIKGIDKNSISEDATAIRII